MLQKSMQNQPVTTYILLAYTISWLCWVPAILLAQGHDLLLPAAANFKALLQQGFENSTHITLSILFTLAVFGPLLAGLFVTYAERGREGVVGFSARIFKWRIAGTWYLSVLLLNLLLFIVPFVIGIASGLLSLNSIQIMPAGYLLLLFVFQIFTSGLGEEPGWRGFLLPRLQQRYGQSKAVWGMGLIWAVWHYPFVILFSFSALATEPSAAVIISILFGLAGFTMSIIGMSFIYAWIYNHTQSVLLAILFHALNNLVPWILVGGLDSSLNIVLALVPWIVVVIMTRLKGRSWYVGDANKISR